MQKSSIWMPTEQKNAWISNMKRDCKNILQNMKYIPTSYEHNWNIRSIIHSFAGVYMYTCIYKKSSKLFRPCNVSAETIFDVEKRIRTIDALNVQTSDSDTLYYVCCVDGCTTTQEKKASRFI